MEAFYEGCKDLHRVFSFRVSVSVSVSVLVWVLGQLDPVRQHIRLPSLLAVNFDPDGLYGYLR